MFKSTITTTTYDTPMSDRHYAYTVILAKDTRDDDSEAILNAIRMVKGVEAVTPLLATPELAVAESRARRAYRVALEALLTGED